MRANRLLTTAAVSTVALLCAVPCTTWAAAGGYADVGLTVTGGAAGPKVYVGSQAQLQQYSDVNPPYTIYITNSFKLTGMDTHIRSNKTVIGVGKVTLSGGGLYLYRSSNVIISNLTISGSTEDDIGIHYSTHIWIDHCTLVDAPDGEIDITQSSDYLTISWCKFYYTKDLGHNFVNLIASSDSDSGSQYHITFHHNWWSTLCMERMPRVRFGRVHSYNNYRSAAGNNYCVGVGNDCQILLENDYFDGVNNAWKNYSSSGHQGLIHWNSGNVFVNTTVPTWAPNSTVFTPPYSYTLGAGSGVKASVTAGAGASH